MSFAMSVVETSIEDQKSPSEVKDFLALGSTAIADTSFIHYVDLLSLLDWLHCVDPKFEMLKYVSSSLRRVLEI